MKLFKFENAHSFFDELNIPRLQEYINHVVIDKIDLTEQEKEGNIEWEDDGIYLNINGNYQRGFMYIKRPYLTRYDKNVNVINDRPRFHLVECSTIEGQKRANNFNNRYFWSNSPKVSLFDYDTGNEYEGKSLKLCKYCQDLLIENIDNTLDFHELLDINNEQVENKAPIETDIQGRPLNWMAISRAYRETQGYICEECLFGGDDLENSYDRRHIHTHHINPNELTNTHTDNLKSLCVLCHSYQDFHHRKNFDKSNLKFQVLSFVRKYKNILVERKNPYITRFLIDNKK